MLNIKFVYLVYNRLILIKSENNLKDNNNKIDNKITEKIKVDIIIRIIKIQTMTIIKSQ